MPPDVPEELPSAGEVRVRDLEHTVRRLEAEKVRLLKLLRLTAGEARLPDSSQTALFDRAPGQVDATSSPVAKVAFFRALFGARTDVYAVRWENARTHKSGWMPAVAGGFRKGVRPQDRAHLPLTDEVVEAHLRGEIHLGLYPLLDGDRCYWLAADFDGSVAMLDALAYLKAARAADAPAALEVSRSGVGAHVWIFFTDPVPAATARALGTAFVGEAIALRGRMDLRSYDRLFPSQDVLSAGGIGNLIAAPLQGRGRRDGATVFLDLATMEPHEDQFAYLSTLERLSPGQVARIVSKTRTARVGMSVDQLQSPTSTRTRPQPAPVVRARLGPGITLDIEALTPALLSTLKHAASMSNPEFYERQRRRASVWNIPRFICSYDETLEGTLVLPRGLQATVQRLVQQSGSTLEVIDERATGQPQEFTSSTVLRPEQQAAVDAFAGRDLGVLVGRPGVGKTVIGCALIAQRSTSTLVLVDRKTLADQWRSRVSEILGVKAGQLGGGRSKMRGTVDVAMLQTLARREDVAELTGQYGMVLVDECHHIPAAAFEYAVRQIPARTWLGLTATPYRRDRLDDLIGLQLGPVIHTIGETNLADTLNTSTSEPATQAAPVLIVHRTAFCYTGDANPSEPGGIAAVYRDLLADSERNTQVLGDVADALERGRNCLVLTQWTRHVDLLAEQLAEARAAPVVLKGGMGTKATRAALESLSDHAGSESLLVVATGPYVGEGFDCPVLDTLFLVAPIAFKGRLVQYAGRILRSHPDKATAEVHDYYDVKTPVLASSLAKRAPGYVSLGFPDPRRES